QADLPNTPLRAVTLDAADRARLKRGGFNDAEIDSWFGDAEFEVAAGELRVTVGRAFVGNWIRNHFAQRLERAWAAEYGEVSVVVRFAAVKEKAA
ncbi:MAG TPA: DnaA N-terminal domain-containing protein, partial [Rhizomicrobium sp.]